MLYNGCNSVFDRNCLTRNQRHNVSNHLACLRDCGLVISLPQGRYTLYQLSDERVNALLGLAEELLADVARGVYECTRYQSLGEQTHKNEVSG